MAVVAQCQHDWRTGFSACRRCDLRGSSTHSGRHSVIVNCCHAWCAAGPLELLTVRILCLGRELHCGVHCHRRSERQNRDIGQLGRRTCSFTGGIGAANAADAVDSALADSKVGTAIAIVAEAAASTSRNC